MDERVNPFLNRRVAFEGKLGGMTQREAAALVRRLGGTPAPRDDERVDLVVIGAEELVGQASSPAIPEEFEQRQAGTPAPREFLTETELWQKLGLLDEGHATRRLYTPAMLADLLGVPVAAIRRWHKSGLIHPLQTVHRLPYFAFEEIAVARRLVELVENGATPEMIEARLRTLARHWPNVNRPLAQLALVVEGRRLLVKRGDAILEPTGQKRFDFEPRGDGAAQSPEAGTIPLRPWVTDEASHSPQQLVAMAEELDEAGDTPGAAEMYRAALLAGGPDAQVSFQLAECLYRMNDLAAARERYAMAVELDDDFLEARCNLGCVLAELGSTDLAIAAWKGALAVHPDYADVHYHLSRLLDAGGRKAEAQEHRRRFHELSPASPWGEERASQGA